jgi:hypothetical protein
MHPQRIRLASKPAPPQLLFRRLIGHCVCMCVSVWLDAPLLIVFRTLEGFRGGFYVRWVGSFTPGYVLVDVRVIDPCRDARCQTDVLRIR